jgi:hypothetical protein
MLKKYFIIYFQFLFHFLLSINVEDSTLSKKSINIKFDFSTNNVFGYTKNQMFYGDKSVDLINYFYFVLGPQYTFNKVKTKKTVIFGIYIDFGKEFLKLRNGNINNYYFIYDRVEKKTLEVHFLRLGVSSITQFKNNFCYGFDFNFRKNIYFDVLEGRYLISDKGLITALTNGLINLDCSFSLNIGYSLKDNIIFFQMTSPQYFENDYLSVGFKFIRKIFYVKNRN